MSKLDRSGPNLISGINETNLDGIDEESELDDGSE